MIFIIFVIADLSFAAFSCGTGNTSLCQAMLGCGWDVKQQQCSDCSGLKTDDCKNASGTCKSNGDVCEIQSCEAYGKYTDGLQYNLSYGTNEMQSFCSKAGCGSTTVNNKVKCYAGSVWWWIVLVVVIVVVIVVAVVVTIICRCRYMHRYGSNTNPYANTAPTILENYSQPVAYVQQAYPQDPYAAQAYPQQPLIVQANPQQLPAQGYPTPIQAYPQQPPTQGYPTPDQVYPAPQGYGQ